MSTTAPTVIEKSKVTHHAWAEPKLREGEGKKLIGTIIGRATGIKAIKMPNGDVFEGLKGMFEASNAETGEVTSSGVCYLPSGFHDLVIEKLRSGDGEQLLTVEFAYRVFSVPATNPQKFSYAFEPLMPPQETDELSNLRKLTAKPPAPQAKIEAPKSPTTKAA